MIKHTLLLIDDDTLVINTLRKRFESFQTEVLTASSPTEAKEILEKRTPSLVVLDLLLTKEDGSSGILDYLKSKEELKQVPIIILTNLEQPELKSLLLKQGVKEYIIKGQVSVEDLYNKIMRYLEP